MDVHCTRARHVIAALSLTLAAPAGATETTTGLEPVAALVRESWAARAAVAAAEARIEAARSRRLAAEQPLYNPELDLDAETAETDSFSVGLTQAIDWSDKRSARAAVAAHRVNVARAELRAARYAVAADVLHALAARASASRRVTLAEERLGLMARFADVTSRRLAAGDINRADATLAELARRAAELARAQAVAELAVAEQRLREASALDRVRWPDLPADLPPPPQATPSADVLVQRVPALKALQARSLAAEAGVTVAERARRADPSIGVRAGFEDSDTATDRLVGLSLSVPLNVRNRFLAEVDAARAESLTAEKALHDAARQAQARAAGAARRYRVLHDAWMAWHQATPALVAERETLLRRLFTSGELDATSYLVQLREGLDAREQGLSLAADAWQAWVDWLDASGELPAWLGLGPANGER